MDILDLLRSDGSIVVNKKLAHEIGLPEAVIYSELVSLYKYWSNREKLVDNKWFYCTANNLEKNTALKRKPQDRAITKLERMGLIEVKKMGLPAKRYFAITNKIHDLFLNGTNKNVQKGQSDNIRTSKEKNTKEAYDGQFDQNGQTRTSNVVKQESPKRAINNTINNNTKLITDDDNKESMLTKLNKIVESHSYLKPLFEYLKHEMLDPSIVQNILIEMLNQDIYDYRLIDARNQLDYMKNGISRGESYPFFAKFYVNGLKKRSLTAIDVEKENQLSIKQQEQRDTSIYYDWLNA